MLKTIILSIISAFLLTACYHQEPIMEDPEVTKMKLQEAEHKANKAVLRKLNHSFYY